MLCVLTEPRHTACRYPPPRMKWACIPLLIRIALSVAICSGSLIPLIGWCTDTLFVYDAGGRLVQVVAADGSSARYSYDAAGNILSIDHLTAATPAVTAFSHPTAAIGSSITIYGSGFSTVAAENQVLFNGTAATVVAATTNELTVTVPAGATAGLVSVVSPNGTATSAAHFSPLTPAPPPSIISLNPTVGSVATSLVAISGTGFPWGASSNTVSFNGQSASVLTASPLQLRVQPSLPVRSGPVVVSGLYGPAAGTVDFFVSPNPQDVLFTGRLFVDGGPITVSIPEEYKEGLLLMDGVVSQELSVQVSGATYQNCASNTIYLLGPETSNVIPFSMSSCTQAAYYKIPESGLYKFRATTAGYVGEVTLNVVSAPTVQGSIALDGSPITVTTTIPAQQAALTFDSTVANQTISLQISSPTYQSACSNQVLKLVGPLPATTQVGTRDLCASATAYTLPTAGTYKILIDPYQSNTGSVTIKLQNAPTVTLPISIDGSPVTATTTVPAQKAELTFSTSVANQIVSLQITGASYQSACGNHTIKLTGPAPATTQLASQNLCSSATAYTLPSVGTYKLTITPSNGNFGSVTVKLANAPTVTGTLTLGGSALTVTTTVPAQIAQISFNSAVANQSVSVVISGSTYPSGCANQSLKVTGPTPATTQRGSTTTCSATRTYTLGPVGTYMLTVKPYNFDTGSVTLRVQ